MMSHILPKNHKDTASAHDHLGHLHLQTTNWRAAYICLNFARNLKQKTHPITHPVFETTFNGLANYYKAIQNYPKALDYYEKALKCHGIHQISVAVIKLNQASIHILMKNFGIALKLRCQAFEILTKTQSTPELAMLHYKGTEGDWHLAQQEYSMAMKFYIEALELSEKALLIGDLRRVHAALALIECYRRQMNIKEAESMCEEQIRIYETHLTRDYSSIAYFQMKQAELYDDDNNKISLQLKLYEEALNILQKNTHLHHEKTVQCLTFLAVHLMKHQNEYEIASDRLKSALNLQEKIYPKSHSIIQETKNLIDECNQIYPVQTNESSL